ncbi:MAG: hypothetical protein ACFFDN_19900 [Candidatus Hodarchaeota archaeon]
MRFWKEVFRNESNWKEWLPWFMGFVIAALGVYMIQSECHRKEWSMQILKAQNEKKAAQVNLQEVKKRNTELLKLKTEAEKREAEVESLNKEIQEEMAKLKKQRQPYREVIESKDVETLKNEYQLLHEEYRLCLSLADGLKEKYDIELNLRKQYEKQHVLNLKEIEKLTSNFIDCTDKKIEIITKYERKLKFYKTITKAGIVAILIYLAIQLVPK